MVFLSLLLALSLATFSNAFQLSSQRVQMSRTVLHVIDPTDVDPNFEAHLSQFLKVGQLDRPSPDVASDLRKRYLKIVDVKRQAAKALTTNPELAVEVINYIVNF